jgi:transglutaminase-like putative cysteine protease
MLNEIFRMLAVCGLSALALAAAPLSDAAVHSVRSFSFSYTVTVKELPAEAEYVELWVPLPQTDLYQEVGEIEVSAPTAYSILKDDEYGNRFLHMKLERHAVSQFDVAVRFNAARRAVGENRLASDNVTARYLQSDELVPLDGKIAEAARAATKAVRSRQEQARALYDHLLATMAYDKSGEGWGRGDALYACDVRKGNCTDFHSLFIGMARSLKIPARFVIGFSIPTNVREGAIAGYHCWAEYFVERKGWLPVDISEAWKNPERRDFYFNRLDPDRIAFSIGRDVQLRASSPAVRVNYFVYPHVVVDGQPYENVEKKFSFRELK